MAEKKRDLLHKLGLIVSVNILKIMGASFLIVRKWSYKYGKEENPNELDDVKLELEV